MFCHHYRYNEVSSTLFLLTGYREAQCNFRESLHKNVNNSFLTKTGNTNILRNRKLWKFSLKLYDNYAISTIASSLQYHCDQ